MAALYIDDEDFWKKQCLDTYGQLLPIHEHGASYKQAFLETFLEQKLENWKVESFINNPLD